MPFVNDHSPIRTRAAAMILAAAMLLGIGTLWSCTVTEKNYATLSFFFDGVPDPNAKTKDGVLASAAQNIKDSPTYSVHKPFADASCVECHSTAYELTPQDSGICLKCHKDQTTKYPKMHGPVAAAACLWCHAPHESAEAHLLKKPAREVCLQCHEVAQLGTERVPEHGDAKRSCVDCHSGHGGTVSFFIRPKPDGAPSAMRAGGKDPEPKEPAAKESGTK